MGDLITLEHTDAITCKYNSTLFHELVINRRKTSESFKNVPLYIYFIMVSRHSPFIWDIMQTLKD